MTDKMREEFEAWWLSGTYPFRTMDRLEDAGVSEEAAQEIWQASREALVIELPAENPLGTGPGDCEGGLPSFEQHCAAECNFILRDCREAIEEAGLKVKP